MEFNAQLGTMSSLEKLELVDDLLTEINENLNCEYENGLKEKWEDARRNVQFELDKLNEDLSGLTGQDY